MRKESSNTEKLETKMIEQLDDIPNDENIYNNGRSRLLINETKEFIPKSFYESRTKEIYKEANEISDNITNFQSGHGKINKNFNYDVLSETNRMEIKMIDPPFINQDEMFVKKSNNSLAYETDNSLYNFNNHHNILSLNNNQNSHSNNKNAQKENNVKFNNDEAQGLDIEAMLKNESIFKKVNNLNHYHDNNSNQINNSYICNNNNNVLKEEESQILAKSNDKINAEKLSKNYNSMINVKNAFAPEMVINSPNKKHPLNDSSCNAKAPGRILNSQIDYLPNFNHFYKNKDNLYQNNKCISNNYDLNKNFERQNMENNKNGINLEQISNPSSENKILSSHSKASKEDLKNPSCNPLLEAANTNDRDQLKSAFGLELTTFQDLDSNVNLNKNEIELINYNSGNNFGNKPRRYNRYNVRNLFFSSK